MVARRKGKWNIKLWLGEGYGKSEIYITMKPAALGDA